MADLEYFTVLCAGIGAIQIDYVDLGTEPDEEVVYAFVDFIAREKVGTVHWLSGLDPPRGIMLDPVRGRFATEDGQLRTIIAHPKNEKQLVTATGTPVTLVFDGQPTAPFASTADPPAVQAALEALPNIEPGDVYVTGKIRNEKQTVTVTGGATGGYFLLTFGADTTIPISRNASASTVQSVLQALPSIGANGCSVTGSTGGPWTVEFADTLAGVDVPALTSAPRSETQVITVSGLAEKGSLQLNYAGQVTADIVYNAMPAVVQAALEALSNINPGDIAVGADNAGGPYTITFTGPKANSEQPLILPVAFRNERQLITLGGTRTGGTFSVTFNGQTCTGIPYNASSSVLRAMLETACNNIDPSDISVNGNPGGPYTITFAGQYANLNVPQMSAVSAITPSGTVAVTTIQDGLGFGPGGPTISTETTVEPVFLTPAGAVAIATTVVGTAGTPWTVNFIGTYEQVDVPAMTATNATVSTTQGGTGDLGVELVANTPVLELGTDAEGNDIELIYDVVITVPDLDPYKVDRQVTPFGIAAPKVGGTTVDLADASTHLPPKPV